MLKQWIKTETIPIIVILILFSLLTAITWNKWGYLASFDNGKEIVLPYLMSRGVRLYNDINYIYGPLPLIYFTFLVKLFGVRLELFYYTGLFIVISYSILLYATSRFILTRFSATIVSLLFLTQLAFFSVGMFTFVFPYYYGVIFGSFLVILELFLLLLCMKKPERLIYLWLAALIAVVCFLIKQDFFLACCGLITFYFLIIPLGKIDFEKGQSAKWLIKKYLKNFDYIEFIKIIVFITISCIAIFLLIAYIIGIDRAFEAMLPFQMSKDQAYIILTRDTFRTIPTLTNFIEFIQYGIAVPIVLLFSLSIIYFVVEGVSNKELRGKVIILLLLLALLFIYMKIPGEDQYLFIVWVAVKMIEECKNLYFGINLWVLITLIFALINYRSEENRVVVICCVTAFLMNYRMFFRLHLDWFAFYYLASSLIIFCYIMSKHVRNLAKIDKRINIKSWDISIKILLVSLIVFYSFVLTGLYNFKNIKINTPYGVTIFDKESFYRYEVIERAAKYVKSQTNPDDTILAYPGMPLLYLIAERLPASRHHFAIPTAIVTQKHRQELYRDILTKKPKYILISREKTGEFYGRFGSKRNYPEILRFIKEYYKPVKVIESKKPDKKTLDIDIYQYKQ